MGMTSVLLLVFVTSLKETTLSLPTSTSTSETRILEDMQPVNQCVPPVGCPSLFPSTSSPAPGEDHSTSATTTPHPPTKGTSSATIKTTTTTTTLRTTPTPSPTTTEKPSTAPSEDPHKRCGYFAAKQEDGDYPICSSDDEGAFCCSSFGYCGNSTDHCDCEGCVNFRKSPDFRYPRNRWIDSGPNKGKCGFNALVYGAFASCNPDSEDAYCCSSNGECGAGPESCECVNCFNFRNENETESSPGTEDVERDVKFYLYNNSNDPNSSIEIIFGNVDSMRQITLNDAPLLKFLIHGWRSSSSAPGTQLLKNDYLTRFERQNQPLILVDWSPLAASGFFGYPDVIFNRLPAVASHIRQFISDLRSNNIIPSFNYVHLIGHSLGGQISGKIGYEIQTNHIGQRLWRITGLDPAGPGFVGRREPNRLDRTDANFVDVLHTSMAGDSRAIGHVDFRANENSTLSQPGCNNLDVSCSHSKAWDYFARSVYDQSIHGCNCGTFYEPSMCLPNIVFGEHIQESVRGEYCIFVK